MGQKYIISIDWLQIFAHCQISELSEIITSNPCNYTFVKEEQATPMWLEYYSIYLGLIKYASFYRSPRSSALDVRACTLKLENRVLYSGKCIYVLDSLVKYLHLEYKGLTRLDLCLDCNTLAGGRSVESFLRDYVFHDPFCNGHIIRNGSRRFQLVGTRSTYGATAITGLRWGSPKSDVCCYCYNKTLELLEVKDKPWIRDSWASAGLTSRYDELRWNKFTDKQKQKEIDHGNTLNVVQDSVWRFEISIKAQGRDLLDLDTGSLFKLDYSSLSLQTRVEDLFFIYASKYLDFRMSTGQSNIKHYPTLELFEKHREVTERPFHVSNLADTGRTEKICANKLLKLLSTYGDLTSQSKKDIDSAISFLFQISGMKSFRVRQIQQENYLIGLAAQRFREGEFKTWAHEYFLYCENLRVLRSSVSYDAACSFFGSLKDCVQYEIDYQQAEQEKLATPQL